MTQATPSAIQGWWGNGREVPAHRWRYLSQPQAWADLPKGIDAAYEMLRGRAIRARRRQGRYLARAESVLARQAQWSSMTQPRLEETIAEVRELTRRGRCGEADLLTALGVLREVVYRTMGFRLHREQVAAALAMWDGGVAELATGEGKTVTATLPGVLGGWRGRGCHVITVNDYLAQRDAQEMGPIYRMCGLRASFITGQSKPSERRSAYAADVTYCTNKEVTADYLRDRIALSRTGDLASALLAQIAEGESGRGRAMDEVVMRGLEWAIIDEADSVLIDEAVTPLIISSSGGNAGQIESFKQAARLASELNRDLDFKVDWRHRDVELTERGRQRLPELIDAAGLDGLWRGQRRREEMVTQALTARHFYQRDKQYVIQDGKVVIVDEATGRLMPDRTWREGLHQAVEAREEGVEVTAPKETQARLSFQRFFRLYRRLCGMTGTAWEARDELWRVYALPVVRIPTHRPCVRVQRDDRVLARSDDRWSAVADLAVELHERNKPVLIGTRSVAASEEVSRLLRERGVPHQVLNAVKHEEEADIVRLAGQPGAVTVATNMAGRGTDIKLGPGVAELGGLHVIATERHESRRVDRQLFGRAGRQGDPGFATALISLEDELFERHASRWGVRLARWLLAVAPAMGQRWSRRLTRKAQDHASSRAAAQRRGVTASDDQIDQSLGFAGR